MLLVSTGPRLPLLPTQESFKHAFFERLTTSRSASKWNMRICVHVHVQDESSPVCKALCKSPTLVFLLLVWGGRFESWRQESANLRVIGARLEMCFVRADRRLPDHSIRSVALSAVLNNGINQPDRVPFYREKLYGRHLPGPESIQQNSF